MQTTHVFATRREDEVDPQKVSLVSQTLVVYHKNLCYLIDFIQGTKTCIIRTHASLCSSWS